MRSARLVLALVAAVHISWIAPARADDSTAPSSSARAEPVADSLLAPSVAATASVVRQRDVGFDLLAGVRERMVSGLVGSEVEARFAVGRRDGRLSLLATGMLLRAIGTRDDTDAQATATAMVALADDVSVGAEGRVRGEVVDGIVASDDLGRPVEVVTGAVVGASVAGVGLRALAGFCWPRGPTPSGPAALVGATFAF